MLAAAFETSTRRPSVALRAGARVLEEALSGERAHASDLLPALDRLLAAAGAEVADLELLVVGLGPGSLTGLRVGVATALGLARGGKAGLFGLPSGEALCWRELAAGEEGIVLLDARQAHAYVARYRREADGVAVLRAPAAVPLEMLEPELAGTARVFTDFGEPLLERLADPARLGPALRARLVHDRVPSAGAALELGLLRHAREGPHAASRLEPLYLRAFGAQGGARRGD